jgi:hypothetical protein
MKHLFSRIFILNVMLACTTPYASPAESGVNSSPAQLTETLWQAFSHPAGQAADVPTLGSLFHPSAVIYGSRSQNQQPKLTRTEVADFLKSLEGKGQTGFYECEIHRQVQQFDRFAAVYSVVESRTDPTKKQADFVGVNSILLNQTEQGWKIVTLYYHLPASAAELKLPLANTGQCWS